MWLGPRSLPYFDILFLWYSLLDPIHSYCSILLTPLHSALLTLIWYTCYVFFSLHCSFLFSPLQYYHSNLLWIIFSIFLDSIPLLSYLIIPLLYARSSMIYPSPLFTTLIYLLIPCSNFSDMHFSFGFSWIILSQIAQFCSVFQSYVPSSFSQDKLPLSSISPSYIVYYNIEVINNINI